MATKLRKILTTRRKSSLKRSEVRAVWKAILDADRAAGAKPSPKKGAAQK